MKLVYLGNQEVGCRCLEAIVQEGIAPLLVIALDDAQDPHRRVLGYRSVREVALDLQLPVLLYGSIKDPGVSEFFSSLGEPFILLSIAWREIIPAAVLQRCRRGFNIHGGLLPEMRGGHPTQWAIIEGLSESGVSLHEMVPKVDTGKVIDIQRFPIGPRDTSLDVRRRHDDAFVALCRKYIRKLLDLDYTASVQDESRARYYPPRKPEDGRIDVSWPFDRIERLTRALSPPYPPAFLEVGTRRIEVKRVVRKTTALNDLCFKCADGYFEVCNEP